MPALAPIPPLTLKRILELYGYTVASEDDCNWALVRQDTNPPIILPKLGELVAVDVMMDALDKAQMNDGTYFELKEIAASTNVPPVSGPAASVAPN